MSTSVTTLVLVPEGRSACKDHVASAWHLGWFATKYGSCGRTGSCAAGELNLLAGLAETGSRAESLKHVAQGRHCWHQCHHCMLIS
jgi:hypothetical protein